VETLLREDLGRVGEAEVVEAKMPTTVEEVKDLSMEELALAIALSCANEIRAVVDKGDGALRLELERWEPDTRDTLVRALAEVGCLRREARVHRQSGATSGLASQDGQESLAAQPSGPGHTTRK
jgi:hypothetical protein